MDKKERVLAAMNHEPVDRLPIGFWFHFPPEKGHGDACVQAHLDYYNNAEVDLVKIMCDGYFDYPNPLAKSVKKASDWFHLKPMGPDCPYIQEQVERARAIREGLREEHVVLYNVFAPFSLIRFAAGDETVMRHLLQEPDAVLFAMKVIARDTQTLCEQLFTRAGIDGIYYCVQGGETNRFTPEQYIQLIRPSDLEVLEYAEQYGKANVLHCCGWAGIPNHMEVWQDYPAKAVNWACFIENMDIAAGKRFFNNRCVLGGFDNRPKGVLNSGTREQVEAETRKLAFKAGRTGAILGADCTLPASVQTERFGWVARTLDENAVRL